VISSTSLGANVTRTGNTFNVPQDIAEDASIVDITASQESHPSSQIKQTINYSYTQPDGNSWNSPFQLIEIGTNTYRLAFNCNPDLNSDQCESNGALSDVYGNYPAAQQSKCYWVRIKLDNWINNLAPDLITDTWNVCPVSN